MRIVFLHPDLGLGGAERLIVDAAVAMKRKVLFFSLRYVSKRSRTTIFLNFRQGHDVTIYTSHYDASHCFRETENLDIVVRGDFMPRSIFGRGHIVFASLR